MLLKHLYIYILNCTFLIFLCIDIAYRLQTLKTWSLSTDVEFNLFRHWWKDVFYYILNLFILFLLFLLFFHLPSLHLSFLYHNPSMTNMSHPSHIVEPYYYFLSLSLSSLPITLYFISHHLTLITSAAQSRPHVTGNLVVDMTWKSHFAINESAREGEKRGNGG